MDVGIQNCCGTTAWGGTESFGNKKVEVGIHAFFGHMDTPVEMKTKTGYDRTSGDSNSMNLRIKTWRLE